MQRVPVLGADVFLFERGEDNAIILSPAIVTGINNIDKTVCLFVMRREGTQSIVDVVHGCEHGNWFYKGEFGV